MTLSYSQHRALIDEIAPRLPAGVQKVYERDRDGFVLQLRGSGVTSYVLVDTTNWARVALVEGKPQQPPAPSAFVMFLRKHVIGCGLQAVELADDDRVARLRLARRPDGELSEQTLVVELFGTPNAYLLDKDGQIEATQHASDAWVRGDSYSPPAPPPALSQRDELELASVSEGERSTHLHAWLNATLAEEAASELRRELTQGLKREARRNRRLIANLEGDLERAEAAQDFRRRGELLQSAYAKEVPRGTSSVKVPDYYAEGAPEVEISLDPAKSLKENIARYFHEYRRMNAAIDDISERLLSEMERSEAFAEAREQVASATHDELEALKGRLIAQGLWTAQRKQRRGRRGNSAQPSYRTFVGHTGARILVGRGAKHNDVLTTRIARGRDVWLHARDWAGAHVVIRMDKDSEPDGNDLRDAALLAAHFSKGRGDSLVDVTYTRAKWVNKPKGSPPGLVTVGGGSTIGVHPDEERVAQLFASEVLDD